MAQSDDQDQLTSNTMLSQGLKEVEGRSGSIGHGDKLPVSVWVWRPHPSHLPIQGCLDVSTFAPDQRRNVSEKEERRSVFSTFLRKMLGKAFEQKSFNLFKFFPDKFCTRNQIFKKLYIPAMMNSCSPFINTHAACIRLALKINQDVLTRTGFRISGVK